MHLSPAALDAAIRFLDAPAEAGPHNRSSVEKYWRRREISTEFADFLSNVGGGGGSEFEIGAISNFMMARDFWC
jgi:hypothetical protein